LLKSPGIAPDLVEDRKICGNLAGACSRTCFNGLPDRTHQNGRTLNSGVRKQENTIMDVDLAEVRRCLALVAPSMHLSLIRSKTVSGGCNDELYDGG
jgi:hypothetical protein